MLNSKAEFNRCYIPRLQLEEQDVEQLEREEEEELEEIGKNLDENLEEWEQDKAVIRKNQRKAIGRSLGRSTKSIATKQKKEQGAKTSKRRKFELVVEGWGQQAEISSLNKLREPPTTTSPPIPNIPATNTPLPCPVLLPSRSPDKSQIPRSLLSNL